LSEVVTVAASQLFKLVILDCIDILDRRFRWTAALAQEGFFVILQRKRDVLRRYQAVDNLDQRKRGSPSPCDSRLLLLLGSSLVILVIFQVAFLSSGLVACTGVLSVSTL
jgi:hypothetical protein